MSNEVLNVQNVLDKIWNAPRPDSIDIDSANIYTGSPQTTGEYLYSNGGNNVLSMRRVMLPDSILIVRSQLDNPVQTIKLVRRLWGSKLQTTYIYDGGTWQPEDVIFEGILRKRHLQNSDRRIRAALQKADALIDIFTISVTSQE